VPSPPWLAVMLHVPTANKFKLLPAVLHTPGVLDTKLTARPDVALASKAGVGVPKRCAPGAAKLMLCGSSAAATLKLTVTGAAAAYVLSPA
jgi:hypothetical protein